MDTRTKIVCTIGPSVNSLEKILELMEAGMSGARLNFSHGTHEEHKKTIDLLKQARQHLNRPLAIILDTKGPEVRLGKIKGGYAKLKAGQRWLLHGKPIEGDDTHVYIHPSYVLDYLAPDTKILFDDGYVSARVIEKTAEGVLVEIQNNGEVKSGKGVNVPNTNLHLPAVTERDIEDIRFGCREDVDIIAASFVRSVENVLTIKKILAEEKKANIWIIAKIENAEGVQNFDSIVQVADGIMVARGDLGVEVPLSQVPRLQKMMIQKSYMAGKPVTTATQMLESMIQNPRPTRAETSDVANAIYDSTSSVMLSGETAIGKYPIETVQTMSTIIQETENDFNYHAFFHQNASLYFHDVPSAVALAAVNTAYSSNARAIFVSTRHGSTARLLSRLRPEIPIIAMTTDEKSYHLLSIIWGVIPFKAEPCSSFEEGFKKVSEFALERGILSYGDLVVMTGGTPFGVAGTTNMMVVENIGNVLVRGHVGLGHCVHGQSAIVLTPEGIDPFSVRDKLLVITRCDESYLPLIKEALGVILENHISDNDSEKYALKIAEELSKPFLIRADAASRLIKEKQLVTLDPEKSIVYKGIVI